MKKFNKSLAAAAACALTAAIGAAWAQAPLDDPAAATIAPGNPQILRFADQGNSPETNPSAHLLLIKDAPQQRAEAPVEPSTTVAQATPAQTEPAPTYDNSTSSTTTTDTTTSTTTSDIPSTTDNSAAADMPPPRADRN
jgi:hypothetical protein